MKSDRTSKIVDAALKGLEKSLAAGKSGQLTTYLAFMAKFHNYSFQNVLLIAAQRPEANHVAGYRKWQELGRQVRAGERGIAIMVPMTFKNKEDRSLLSEEREERSALGFITGYVFDISQTDSVDGKPIPEFAKVAGEPGCHLVSLHDFARDKGISISRVEKLGGARGVSYGGKIELLSGLSAAEEFQVLSHELGHELLHKGDRRGQTSRTVRELEAEAVAFCICSAIGLDAGTACSDYVQLYQGDSTLLKYSMEHIQQAASQIIAALE